MSDDAKRWDALHKKIHSEETVPSLYAREREKLFPRGSLIVELGGGTGADAVYFLQNGHSVVILDISDFALKVAQDRAKEHNLQGKLAVKKVDFGLHQLPIKDGSVDIAYSRISLHYFEASHTVKLFQDIYKMLKPNGKAFLTFKSPDNKEEMEYLENVAVEFEPNVYIENGQLRSRFTSEQLKTMLDQAGISNFEVRPHQEQLVAEKLGHHPVLFLNEVVITKAQKPT
jgi:ubiquinone/menaquinone biosynthesis C-methylase UbiE